MNLLIDRPPKTVLLAGKAVPIETDFRCGMLLEQLMEEPAMGPHEKAVRALYLFYRPEALENPEEFGEALDRLLWFYCCGKSPQELRAPKQWGVPRRIYDYDVDAGRIYAAFLQAYRIDLCKEDLHWWQFRALFSALPEETEFARAVRIRAMDCSKIHDKAQRAHYRRLQALYALPDGRDEGEKAANIGALFAGSFK